MTKRTGFFAYPGSPSELTQPIRGAIAQVNSASGSIMLEGWEQNDISGVPLVEPIITKIISGQFLAADVTFLNDNVSYEIGLALGAKKRCLLVVNSSLTGDRDLANTVGIFDTIGYEKYENSQRLSRLITERTDFRPIEFDVNLNRKAPVYIVEPPKKNEAHTTLVSRTKKARWKYRSFNPDEDIRMGAMDAIKHVAQSAGVIAPLQSAATIGSREHNIRAMFIAGIAHALDIPTLLIHPADYIPPMDVRDLTKKFRHPDDILDAIQEFSLEITEFFQRAASPTAVTSTALARISIGDPTAENEMTELENYYLPTDEYQRALRGEVNLVVGRKGSGKTALFIRLRDAKRQNKANVVVDLKPEGYQLVKLKERVLDFLTAGAQQHLIVALWEYILLLEVTYKVLEKDRVVHIRDHRLTDPYQRLAQFYGDTKLSQEGDFRERLTKLSDHLIHEFLRRFGSLSGTQSEPLNITTGQVTELLYQHDIRNIYGALIKYLSLKGEVWLLFDNLDKGWSVEGVNDTDIFILRCLIDASRKVERELRRNEVKYRSVIFVRDDVYSLLMKGSSDYGKEMRATLDWHDKDILAEILKRRLEVTLSHEGMIWSAVAVSHFYGQPWLEYMVERSLMRPRNLIKLFRFSLGYAINMSHQRIEADDMAKGLNTYARDLITEAKRELSDVFPQSERVIYEFSEENSEFSDDDLLTLIQCAGVSEADAPRVVTFLLYYGILGVKRGNEDPIYIYDVTYDMEMLQTRMRKWGASTKYIVNPALWPALNVTGGDQPKLV